MSVLDFKTMAQEVQQAEWGSEHLAIWGGYCTAGDIISLLQSWPERDKELPYRIWQYTDSLHFVNAAEPLPESERWLERGRLFGPGGDLSFRRAQNRFYWHFVGPTPLKPPTGNYHAADFWQETADRQPFYRREIKPLLWGERLAGYDRWFENRVARAELQYPIDALGRVSVLAWAFSRTGRVEFVWMRELEEKDGNGQD